MRLSSILGICVEQTLDSMIIYSLQIALGTVNAYRYIKRQKLKISSEPAID
jgi:hypothetical protein